MKWFYLFFSIALIGFILFLFKPNFFLDDKKNNNSLKVNISNALESEFIFFDNKYFSDLVKKDDIYQKKQNYQISFDFVELRKDFSEIKSKYDENFVYFYVNNKLTNSESLILEKTSNKIKNNFDNFSQIEAAKFDLLILKKTKGELSNIDDLNKLKSLKFDFNSIKFANFSFFEVIDLVNESPEFKVNLIDKIIKNKAYSNQQVIKKIEIADDNFITKENIIKIESSKENKLTDIIDKSEIKLADESKKTDNKIDLSDNKEKIIKVDNSAIPEGFEDIDTNERVIVNIFFLGEKLIDSFAVVNSQNLTFENPAEIVNSANQIINKEDIIKALTPTLPLNSEKSCFPKRFLGCNDIDTPNAAIVYYPDKYRVDLIVNNSYLKKPDEFDYKYKESTQKGISTLSNFNVNFDTDNTPESQINYNVRSNHYLSYKNMNVMAMLDYKNDELLKVNELISKLYHKDQEYTFGFTSMKELQMSSGASFFGASINRFYSSRQKRDMIYSKRIEIYLPYYSEVKIYKDDRLYSQEFYNAGNHILRTSALPNGSYDIKLKIKDSRGTREETHFFTKTSKIPIYGEPFYYGDIGFLEKKDRGPNKRLPEVSSIAIGRIGGGVRLNDYFGLLGNVVATRFESGVEAILELQHPSYRLSTKYLTTSEKDNSVSIEADSNFFNQKFNVNLSATKTVQGNDDKDLQNEDASFNMVSKNSSSLNLSGNYILPYDFGNISLKFNRAGESKGKFKYSYGASYDKIIWNHNGFRINLNLKYDQSKIDKSYYTNIRTSYSKNGFSLSNTTTKNLKYKTDDKNSTMENPFTNNLFISWDDKNILKDRLVISATHNYNDKKTNERFIVDYDGILGTLKTTTSHDDKKTSHSANYKFTVASNNLNFAIGRGSSNDGAVIAKVKGSKSSKAKFIVGSGSNSKYIKVNSSKLLPKSSFAEYNVTLTADQNTMAELKEATKTATIFPGNVITLNYEANETAIVMGRLIDENGQGISGYIKSSVEESFSDEDGNFQLYSFANDIIMVESLDGKKCKAQLQDLEINNSGVSFVDDIICKRIYEDDQKETNIKKNLN